MSNDPATVPRAQAGSSRVPRQRRPEEYDPQRLGLPKPPGFIRTFFRRNPWLVDTALMGVFYYSAIGALISEANMESPSALLLILSGILSAATTAGILFRRFVPRILAGLSSVLLFFVVPGVSTNIVGGIAMVIAIYALAVYRSARSAWLWTIIGVVSAAAGVVVGGSFDLISIIFALFGNGMVFVIASLSGITVGNRVRYLDAILDRAAQLARERDQQAQLATASERARIAREMHDIVAHSLTVMIALADGATSVATTNPERAQDAMGHVAEIGRTSLTDMRRVLGVLTEASVLSDAGVPAGPTGTAPLPRSPQPTLDQLWPLVDSYRAAGLPIFFTLSGAVPQDSAVQLTVFRVVQEALTNALRYARTPTRVEALVDFTPEGVASISVTDDGLAPIKGEIFSPSIGSGRGLTGMRERVAVYGGSVEAGAIDPHGWRVRARLPFLAAPLPSSPPLPFPAPSLTHPFPHTPHDTESSPA